MPSFRNFGYSGKWIDLARVDEPIIGAHKLWRDQILGIKVMPDGAVRRVVRVATEKKGGNNRAGKPYDSTTAFFALHPPHFFMAVTFPHHIPMKPPKRARRTATTVLAGAFDVRPQRDVLTSLLNGVTPYTPLLRIDDDEARRLRKREKKERERERKRQRLAAMADEKPFGDGVDAVPGVSAAAAAGGFPIAMPRPSASTASFWRGHTRPSIHIPAMQRSVSVTPPPFTSPLLLPSTPASTPGPSNSSSTSRTSSKRPRTPDDYEDFMHDHHLHQRSVSSAPRKPRAAAKKGWKGWVEGSPPPSEKLINLDAVPVLQERRTRSGKNFDAIGVGKDGWV
ncbi:hypothetical protein B0H17DRAFT_1136775 [Mycena rosella]|uniref:Uncharacterized protein n=1 Tax=Mycena rosella TaxID=1033263 RepID=A0AAD7DAK4_MYCRO|nr:hypothetical protein B0H17DRAFT_1136775 [Mycena rosella]